MLQCFARRARCGMGSGSMHQQIGSFRGPNFQLAGLRACWTSGCGVLTLQAGVWSPLWGWGAGASYPARYCPSHLCIASSHFWPFTKANLVLINFSKTFKSGPPPPFVFLAGEAGVGITFSRSWIYSNLPHFKHSYCYCIDKRLVKVVGHLFVHIGHCPLGSSRLNIISATCEVV